MLARTDRTRGETTVFIRKNRNGRTGTAELWFNAPATRFEAV